MMSLTVSFTMRLRVLQCLYLNKCVCFRLAITVPRLDGQVARFANSISSAGFGTASEKICTYYVVTNSYCCSQTMSAQRRHCKLTSNLRALGVRTEMCADGWCKGSPCTQFSRKLHALADG